MTHRFAHSLVLCLFACSGGTAATQGPNNAAQALSDAGAPQVETPTPPPSTSIRLPADEAPHADPIEWWYYTGLLRTAADETYGFEFVVFQAVMRESMRAYLGHFAVTDRAKGTFHLATRSAMTGSRESGPGFDLEVDGWHMKGHAGSDHLAAELDGYALELALTAQKPVVLQYGNGEMTLGSEKPFYYYSYTRMAASGTLRVGDRAEPVEGTVWMDHQWGEMGGDFDGWDWFSLRLDDNTEVMIFNVRRAGEPGFFGGTFVAADGSFREIDSAAISFTPTGTWTSPHNGGTYPHGWNVRVSSLELEVAVTPVLADQEFHQSVFHAPVYWEGLCDVRGKRGSRAITGHAYVELVGYAHQ